jgi:hypothetical protein
VTATTQSSEPMAGDNGKPGKVPRKTNEPFRRIKPRERTAEELEFDNRYELKVFCSSFLLLCIPSQYLSVDL